MRSTRGDRHQSLAGVDGDTDLQLELRIVAVQLIDGSAHRKAGSDRALRIVAVSHGRAEHGHHGIADELLDDAAERLDLGANPGEVRRQDRPDVLRVEALCPRSETDEIGEENRDDLAFLGEAMRLVGKRLRASQAELRDRRVLLAAAGTDYCHP